MTSASASLLSRIPLHLPFQMLILLSFRASVFPPHVNAVDEGTANKQGLYAVFLQSVFFARLPRLSVGKHGPHEPGSCFLPQSHTWPTWPLASSSQNRASDHRDRHAWFWCKTEPFSLWPPADPGLASALSSHLSPNWITQQEAPRSGSKKAKRKANRSSSSS